MLAEAFMLRLEAIFRNSDELAATSLKKGFVPVFPVTRISTPPAKLGSREGQAASPFSI
jgi:hypothetical protein